MILEWLAPASAVVLGARILWSQLREGWHDWTDGLKIAGTVVFASFVVGQSIAHRHSLGMSLVSSALYLTVAFMPVRVVMRLIGAKRPNPIEDPELFEDGELKPPPDVKQLPGPDPD